MGNVWNIEWKKFSKKWNGRFLSMEWDGMGWNRRFRWIWNMEKFCSIPFYSMP